METSAGNPGRDWYGATLNLMNLVVFRGAVFVLPLLCVGVFTVRVAVRAGRNNTVQHQLPQPLFLRFL